MSSPSITNRPAACFPSPYPAAPWPAPCDTVAHSRACSVKITTTVANHVVEGTVFAADPVLNAIVINTSPAPPNPSTNLASQPGNYHVVSIPHIQEFKILGEDGAAADGAGPVGGFESAMPSISAMDLGALKAREDAAVRKLLEKEATRNRGVSKEAQEIFDAINRTYVFPSHPSPHHSSLGFPSLEQNATTPAPACMHGRSIYDYWSNRHRLPTRWHDQTIIVNEAVMLGPPYTVNDLKAAEGKERNIELIRKIMEGHAARKKNAQGANKPGVATPIPPRKGG